jgi:hypothetical protein
MAKLAKPTADEVETAKSESKKEIELKDNQESKLSPILTLLRLILVNTLRVVGDINPTWVDAILPTALHGVVLLTARKYTAMFGARGYPDENTRRCSIVVGEILPTKIRHGVVRGALLQPQLPSWPSGRRLCPTRKHRERPRTHRPTNESSSRSWLGLAFLSTPVFGVCLCPSFSNCVPMAPAPGSPPHTHFCLQSWETTCDSTAVFRSYFHPTCSPLRKGLLLPLQPPIINQASVPAMPVGEGDV